MDLCTGPLARASRLSADALTCGWPDGQPCGLPTRPTTGRRLHTSSTALDHDRPNRARQECKGPVRRSGLASRHDSTSGAASPLQYDIVPTIFPAQHSIGSESVTLPKSPVTFAEIRSCTWNRAESTAADCQAERPCEPSLAHRLARNCEHQVPRERPLLDQFMCRSDLIQRHPCRNVVLKRSPFQHPCERPYSEGAVLRRQVIDDQ